MTNLNLVRANFRRRKRVAVNCCEERVFPPPPLPPSPSVLPTTPSLSPLERTIDEEAEREHQIIDWQAPLALWEWKAWGYYARPWINGVWVNNYRMFLLPVIYQDRNICFIQLPSKIFQKTLTLERLPPLSSKTEKNAPNDGYQDFSTLRFHHDLYDGLEIHDHTEPGSVSSIHT